MKKQLKNQLIQIFNNWYKMFQYTDHVYVFSFWKSTILVHIKFVYFLTINFDHSVVYFTEIGINFRIPRAHRRFFETD